MMRMALAMLRLLRVNQDMDFYTISENIPVILHFSHCPLKDGMINLDPQYYEYGTIIQWPTLIFQSVRIPYREIVRAFLFEHPH